MELSESGAVGIFSVLLQQTAFTGGSSAAASREARCVPSLKPWLGENLGPSFTAPSSLPPKPRRRATMLQPLQKDWEEQRLAAQSRLARCAATNRPCRNTASRARRSSSGPEIRPPESVDCVVQRSGDGKLRAVARACLGRRILQSLLEPSEAEYLLVKPISAKPPVVSAAAKRSISSLSSQKSNAMDRPASVISACQPATQPAKTSCCPTDGLRTFAALPLFGFFATAPFFPVRTNGKQIV